MWQKHHMTDYEDKIFKALSDPIRRKILDLVRDTPGMNVNELSIKLEISRFGAMKHLKLLESAKLVISRKEWKEKKLFINATPIKQVLGRWITKYENQWADRLEKLKIEVEED